MSSEPGRQFVQHEQRTILGHPVGLFVLFFTELWERFSYYGMRALLVLYMVDFFKWTQEEASKVYKWYTSLVYLTPLLGGFLADRYLGNKAAIVIGAILMAMGQFLLTVDEVSVFYLGLGALIIGNGFFKPNMSVQVGRLYPKNDPRRDGAYTIFYMGINIGAFLAPIVCGAFRETPELGYDWGFCAAGIGMILGLLIYLFGLPLIKELPDDVVYGRPSTGSEAADRASEHVMTEDEAWTTPSAAPVLSRIAPGMLVLLGLIFMGGAPLLGWQLGWRGIFTVDNVISFEIAGGSILVGAWILGSLNMAIRDRVLAMFILLVFVVFFWGAFEQAGNAMNVWADQTTNRYLIGTPEEPSVFPKAPEAEEEGSFWPSVGKALKNAVSIQPMLTTSFQSINPFAIVIFAPLFAWLWVFLARRGVNLSIAAKMAIGVFMQGVAFALMIWSVTYENGPSTSALARLPDRVVAQDDDRVYFHDVPDFGNQEKLEKYRQDEPIGKDQPMIAHGGRLGYDEASGTLHMRGVLNENHRDRILRATTPKWFVEEIWILVEQSREAYKAAKERGEKEIRVEKRFDRLPDGFEPRYLNGYKSSELEFDADTNTLVVKKELADRDYKQILVSGADPVLRAALNELYVSSAKYKVSSWWLIWFYVLCTLGELCLSPVGLSMVSKLAPRRFATMLMGMWLLTSFFGNFTAGLAGENWERLDPSTYFTYVTLAMAAAAFLCFLLARKITAMMHGVK